MLHSNRYLKIITIIIIRDSRERGGEGEVIGAAVKIIIVVVVLQTVGLTQYWVADHSL